MQTNGLKGVKYIGASRMKSLKDLGIDTLEQLNQTPLDQLAQIPAIGKYYAKLIKAAAAKMHAEKPEQAPPTTMSGAETNMETSKEISIKEINLLKKRLKRLVTDSPPPKKKKKLELYLGLKKKSDTLINRLFGLDQIQSGLSKETLKNIIKRADALNTKLKNAGGRIKKKKIRKLDREIRTFSKILKKTVS